MSKKDIVLYIHDTPTAVFEHLDKLKNPEGDKVRVAVIGDSKERSWEKVAKNRGADITIPADLSKPLKIAKALLPYQDQLLAVTSRDEAKMNEFAKIIPHVPYLKTPTSDSVIWSSDKIAMRERLHLFNKKINPKFVVVKDSSNKTITDVESKLVFPVIIKPAGLAASRLITICYHKEEFEDSLKKIFKKITTVYKQNKVSASPKVLVEEFMEGSMYSIDGYVNARGKVYFCPMVYIKTGTSIGFDDFLVICSYVQLN